MIPLRVAFWDYDRTLPIFDGRVGIEGCSVACSILAPQVLFPQAFGAAAFDVSELSLSRHAQAVANGTSLYAGVPAFLSRAFRHSSIYVRTDRVRTPADLVGARIGLRNYDDTAAVVARGLLRDEYGVGRDDVTWVVGPMEAGGTPVVPLPALHAPIRIQALAAGCTMDAEFAAGRLDGVIALTPPPCVVAGVPGVGRLFADARTVEREYAARTGLFPVMHLVGVRASLAMAHPWLPGRVLAAFEAAKALAIDGLGSLQACKATLPWAAAELAATQQVLGEDFWPYGLARNQGMLSATLRHLFEDGLLARPLAPGDLFWG